MEEIDQSPFMFRNADLFWRKIQLNQWSLNQVMVFLSEIFEELKKSESW